jgi:hypothetical protein
MLNGVAPLLIFTFPPLIGIDLSKILGGIPLVGDSIPNIGTPIPIYLDEGLTGIYIESESHSIDIDTDITPKYVTNVAGVTTTSLINQTGLNNLVTINMLASRDSLLLTVLLSLTDMIFSRVTSGKYQIHYINKGTVVFGSLLHSFQTSQTSDDTLLKITMQLQKNNQNKTESLLNQYYNSPVKAAVEHP